MSPQRWNELALAVAPQYTLNRQLAALRAESQSLVVFLTVFAAVCLIALTGVGFLLAALYAALLERYDTPSATAIMGGALFVIAGAIVAIGMVRARLKAARSAAAPPVASGRSVVAQREADAVFDELKKVLGSALPMAIAAAALGLAVGLAGARIGQEVRANVARR